MAKYEAVEEQGIPLNQIIPAYEELLKENEKLKETLQFIKGKFYAMPIGSKLFEAMRLDILAKIGEIEK